MQNLPEVKKALDFKGRLVSQGPVLPGWKMPDQADPDEFSFHLY